MIVVFNPRSRTGSDCEYAITTPARMGFNPRSRTGSDAKAARIRKQAEKFQSTLPHGERRTQRTVRRQSSRFNPRSRTGSDSPRLNESQVITAFQSTLPHGERL